MSVLCKGASRSLVACVGRKVTNDLTTSTGSSSLLARRIRPLVISQINQIAHKDHIDPQVVANKISPWPYQRKRFTGVHQLFNAGGWYSTTGRFDENTKIITVEGNVGSGKSLFAEKLAQELGMRYFKELPLEFAYVTKEGFDYRSLNHLLPVQVRFPDQESVFKSRNPTQAAVLQELFYRLRYYNYLQALTHLYNTGQGCVIERSPWSDSVFADNLHHEKFFGQSFSNFYWILRSQTISSLQRPHFVIYVDVPVDKCLETIHKRNLPHEVDNLTRNYLTGIERLYKEKFLPRIETHAELMCLQMNEPIDDRNVSSNVEFAICDIENMNFDQFFTSARETEKMDDWKYLYSEAHWSQMRRMYSNEKEDLLEKFYLPTYDVDELAVSPELLEIRDYVIKTSAPQYRQGYNGPSTLSRLFTKWPSIEEEDKDCWFVATS